MLFFVACLLVVLFPRSVLLVVVWWWLPELLGKVMTFVVTRYGLLNEIVFEFRCVRVTPWFDAWRLRIEIRCSRISFGNPKNSSDWCRSDFVVATDLLIDVAMPLRHVLRLPWLFEVWSPRPRDQRSGEKLGVLTLERFEMETAEVAFEQCEGRLNVAAIETRLAKGQVNTNFNRLRVEVLAARDLAKTSTYARVSLRAQQRRSRTIVMHSAPVFAYSPEPMYVTDPSSVLHIAVFEESYLGDSIQGQWATTLKRLVLDPENADGGKGFKRVVDDAYEWRGWLPLRDAKWRSFAQPDLRDAPKPGYPAVLVKIRWERDPTVSPEFDENCVLTALEHIKLNASESSMRIGNYDNVSAMLAAFPYWIDAVGGFKINGRVTAHFRDLYLGNVGDLERRRNRRGGHLTESDWKTVNKGGITLNKVHVVLPNTLNPQGASDERPSFFKKKVESPGLLTLDAAFTALIKGCFDCVLSSGKVAPSIAKVISALSYRALQPGTIVKHVVPPLRHRDDDEDNSVASDDSEDNDVKKLAKGRARARRVPFKGFHGYRSDRQLSVLLGFANPSHKRMDARVIEDLTKPIAACGVLFKTSKPPGAVGRRWKPYRCVLRGATLFYFEIAGPTSQRRRGEDLVIDLHRIVADVPFRLDDSQRKRSSTSLLVKVNKSRSGKEEIFLGTRLDGGAIHHTYLRVPTRVDDEPKFMEALAWDDEATQRLRTPSTLEEWHGAIVDAVCAERARARAEIAKIERDYNSKYRFESSRSFHDDRRRSRSVAKISPERTRASGLNGAWELARRGGGLDSILAAEGLSFGARVLMSASAATLWISVDDVRAVIHVHDGLVSHRFAGPLNQAVQVHKFARDSSFVVLDTVSLEDDGHKLVLRQSLPATRKDVFCQFEWKLGANGLEQTYNRFDAQGNRLSIGVPDEFRPAAPERAIKIELAAAS